MKKEILYSLKSPYRDNLDVIGCRFGSGKKSVAIVGATRGNEIQQMYICSQLVRTMKRLEKTGKISPNCEILIIPCINYYSMNIGKRFWTMGNTDINRMFPGYDQGETTQRIADGVFRKLEGYEYGIQLVSFYQTGNFLPHVKLMETGFTDPADMERFGLKYGIVRKPRPYDTTTLNYNWQIWETKAFSVYSNETSGIDDVSCSEVVAAILRFMYSIGAITEKSVPGYKTEIINESDIYQIRSSAGGIFRADVPTGSPVEQGQVIGRIIDPIDGETISQITTEYAGTVFFEYNQPLINESTMCFKIIV